MSLILRNNQKVISLIKRFSNLITHLIRVTFDAFSTGVYFVFSRLVIILVFLVGLYFNWQLFTGLLEDTTVITNIAFGILATFAALCFSGARAINDSAEDKDKFTFAGERFLHSAVLVVIASLLKYGSIELGIAGKGDSPKIDEIHWTIIFLSSIPGVIVGVLFFWALNSAHGGLVVLNRLLWKRHHRFKDWDDFF